ncbi:MAG: TIGR03067 domain-containing protein [Gemmataceae bacterium]|nr:TIGR03067 domain-containing protein [Gemmataceae bacterium]
MNWLKSVGCFALVVAFASVRADEKKFDAEKMLGKWTYTAGEKAGVKSDLELIQKGTVTITKDTITLQDDSNKFVIKYKIDASKNPPVIDMEITESPFGAGAKAVGIVSLNGDELKICYNPMGETPPEKFETKEGSSANMFVLKRAK